MVAASVVFLAILAVVIGYQVFRAGRLPETARNVAIWLGIGLALFVGYTLRHDFADLGRRVEAELFPTDGVADGDNAIRIAIGQDGHFRIRALVNGVPVLFFVDTGATLVVLSQTDALRIGINPHSLTYDKSAMTANGAVAMAEVRLDRVSIGGFPFRQVPAVVTSGPLEISLLGMSFLRRLESFSMDRGTMVLRFQGAATDVSPDALPY